ncbi:MAG: cytochrome c [Proteobacteria bacterium]|nr:cytochrome c [Pseudomonadota bacterium]
MKLRIAWLAILACAVVALAVLFWPRDRQSGEAPASLSTVQLDPVSRGRALVTLGNCEGCHTVRGGRPFAGGRSIPTPFGNFFSPNITQDARFGIGSWSADDFWSALHNGYAPGRKLLYPTFPYTNFTKLSRADADAMFAYLRTVAAVAAPNREHRLKFPFNQRWLLAVWRGLFFTPGVYEPDTRHDAEWNRGAYLVQGVAHCSACHESRNALGAVRSKDNPSGGLVLSWYAPSLTNSKEAGVQTWSETDIVTLLRAGVIVGGEGGHQGFTFGPMAEVVYDSLQHADPADLKAIAVYLKSLPEVPAASKDIRSGVVLANLPLVMSNGQRIYADHCARCHGDQGEGRAVVAPALAGSRVVNMSPSLDAVRIVLYGGYAPGTQLNPRPFGMPPFYPTLSSEQMASVLTYIRGSWGNGAPPILPDDVEASSTGPLW